MTFNHINKFKTIIELKKYLSEQPQLLKRSKEYNIRITGISVKNLDRSIIKFIQNLFRRKKEAEKGILLEFRMVVFNKEHKEKMHRCKVTFYVFDKKQLELHLSSMIPFLYCDCEAFRYSGASYYLWLQQQMVENKENILLKPPEKDYNNKLLCKHIAAAVELDNFNNPISKYVDIKKIEDRLETPAEKPKEEEKKK